MDNKLGPSDSAAKQNGVYKENDENTGGGGASVTGTGIRQDPTGNLLAPALDVASPLSSDPQTYEKRVTDPFEFEVVTPSEAREVDYDVENDLDRPLEPSQGMEDEEDEGHPDVMEVDVKTYDTVGAMKKYGYTFDDDTDVPKRRALLIGIKGNKVTGSHNDVDDLKGLLMDVYGWKESEVIVLKDEDETSPLYPIRQVVMDHLFILVHKPKKGDRLFLHFSGHGSQILDEDGDETDGLDEVICCADGKIIVDDQLHDIVVKPIPKGCRVTALFDCCSSGTGLDLVKTPRGSVKGSPHLRPGQLGTGALDLPHSWGGDASPDDPEKHHPIEASENGEAGHGNSDRPGFSRDATIMPRDINEAFAGAMDLPHTIRLNDINDPTAQLKPPFAPGRKKFSEGDVVMWSACLDNAESREIMTEGQKAKGAMSHAFVQSLRLKPRQTYQELFQSIQKHFALWEVPQEPQLTSAQKLVSLTRQHTYAVRS